MSDDLEGPGGARHTDPSTSQRAATEVAPSAKTHRGLALRTILAVGDSGLTAAEVAERTGVEGIWKRVSELERAGYVRASGERWNPHTGKMNQVLIPTGKAREWAQAEGFAPAPAPSGTSMYDPRSEWA